MDPSLGSFKLEVMKGNKTIIEGVLSPIVPTTPFKNPGSTTECALSISVSLFVVCSSFNSLFVVERVSPKSC